MLAIITNIWRRMQAAIDAEDHLRKRGWEIWCSGRKPQSEEERRALAAYEASIW